VYLDPGFIKRRPTPDLVRKYNGVIHCGKCMTMDKDLVEGKVFHCPLCDRCCTQYDHHCGVVGACIGKNNIVTFYLMVACAVL
jgi:DHHC palmitoyltransferase